MNVRAVSLFLGVPVPVRRQVVEMHVQLEIQPWMPRGDEVVVDIARQRQVFILFRRRAHVATDAGLGHIGDSSERYKTEFVSFLIVAQFLPLHSGMSAKPLAGRAMA